MATIKKKISGLPAKKKFGKRTLTKVACAKTKAAANSKAKSLRKAGKAARVVKNPAGGACVYSGAKKSTAKRKTTIRRRSRKS